MYPSNLKQNPPNKLSFDNVMWIPNFDNLYYFFGAFVEILASCSDNLYNLLRGKNKKKNVGHGLGPYKNTWLLRKCLGLGPFVCDKESGPTRTDGARLTRYCSGFYLYPHLFRISDTTINTPSKRAKSVSPTLFVIFFFLLEKSSLARSSCLFLCVGLV